MDAKLSSFLTLSGFNAVYAFLRSYNDSRYDLMRIEELSKKDNPALPSELEDQLTGRLGKSNRAGGYNSDDLELLSDRTYAKYDYLLISDKVRAHFNISDDVVRPAPKGLMPRFTREDKKSFTMGGLYWLGFSILYGGNTGVAYGLTACLGNKLGAVIGRNLAIKKYCK